MTCLTRMTAPCLRSHWVGWLLVMAWVMGCGWMDVGQAQAGRGGPGPKGVYLKPSSPKPKPPLPRGYQLLRPWGPSGLPQREPEPEPTPRPLPAAARWSAQLTPVRALWVWGEDAVALIRDQKGARAHFFREVVPPRAEGTRGISLLFVEDPFELLFQPRANAPYTQAQFRNFLAEMHVHGIGVHLVACGHPYWSTGRGCAEKTIQNMLEFNRGGNADTSWDGIQLAIAPEPGKPWIPYVPGAFSPDHFESLEAELKAARKVLDGKLPLGTVVGGDWALSQTKEDLAFLTTADYLAILPYRHEPIGLIDTIEPWLALNTRFLIGLEVASTGKLQSEGARDAAAVFVTWAHQRGEALVARAGQEVGGDSPELATGQHEIPGPESKNADLDGDAGEPDVLSGTLKLKEPTQPSDEAPSLPVEVTPESVLGEDSPTVAVEGTSPRSAMEPPPLSADIQDQLPDGWFQGWLPLEAMIHGLLAGMAPNTPLIGFGFSGLSEYRAMPKQLPLEREEGLLPGDTQSPTDEVVGPSLEGTPPNK